MNKENEELARMHADRDTERVLSIGKALFPDEFAATSYDNIDTLVLPPGKLMISFQIGGRGYFSRTQARLAAKAWRKATARSPDAFFFIAIAGYDDDPREIWQFEDAVRYVRMWARFAGMDDVAVAARYLTLEGNDLVGGMGFLAACGVFGDDLAKEATANFGVATEQ